MAIKIKSSMMVAPMATVMILALAAAAGMANAEMQALHEIKIVSENSKCLAALKGGRGDMVRTEACDNANVLHKWKRLVWNDHFSSDRSELYTFVNKGTGQALKSFRDTSSVTLTSNNIDVNSPYDASIAWTTPISDDGAYTICPAQDGKQNVITSDNGVVFLTDGGAEIDTQLWDFISS